MALNNVTFNRTNGIGALAAGSDHVSGLLFYSDSLPAGFSAEDRVKKIFNLQGAIDLGITKDYADETAATDAEVLITDPGTAGDVNTIKIDSVLLGSYTTVTSDDAADLASGLVDAINALSGDHGFTAELSTATVVITAPAGLGVLLDDSTVAFASTGTAAGTVTQFEDASTTGSLKRVMYYHIEEFFRMKPDGVLYVGIYADPTAFDGAEVVSMQDAANGEMRQVGVYYPNASFASSQLSALQTQLSALRTAHKQLFCVFHADCSSLSLASLPNLSLLSASKVNVNIAEDGNWHQTAYSGTQTYNPGDKFVWLNKTYICNRVATGQAPYDTDYFTEISERIAAEVGYSVSTLGNELGIIASAEVHQNIANVSLFDVASGNNLSTAGFATGETYKAQATSLLNTLNDYHYTFLRKFERNAGTFYNDSYTAISASASDYYSIENNRVMDKVERLSYDSVLPLIANNIDLKADGTLRQETIYNFESKIKSAIESMSNNISIDDDGNSVFSITVSPAQDVLQTSEIACTLEVVPKGVSRKIVVNNSFVVSL